MSNPFETLARIERKLDSIEWLLTRIFQLEVLEMAPVDDILASVEELPTINDSLDALFAQLQALINQGKTDPAKLQQALDILNTQKERTKAAIVANTPAATP